MTSVKVKNISDLLATSAHTEAFPIATVVPAPAWEKPLFDHVHLQPLCQHGKVTTDTICLSLLFRKSEISLARTEETNVPQSTHMC